MPDIINLLPDSVANQIAAGEVVQRPASVVKELMENSIDAGSTHIKVIATDAGKALIQVIDNGCGMSDTDARLSFERHATSKIKSADDLFSIFTFGFRGEAMASIAAIAHVEMKTRLTDDELGTRILVEGTKVILQENCQSPAGTSIAVKNLFFNVPARRNFLKTNPIESKHIIDEFQRVALAHHSVGFSLHLNGLEIYNLPISSLRQRIVNIFGSSLNERIVPLEEDTTVVRLKGFIIKPEFAKKTRGEQFFYVNNRFIKSPYLHHAVQASYKDLIPSDCHASYFIYLDADPQTLDVNIHPTKTEIKFEDEKTVYAILRSAIRRALGKYGIAPTLDFETETSFNVDSKPPAGFIRPPEIKVDTSYNPFEQKKAPASGGGAHHRPTFQPNKSTTDWQQLFAQAQQDNALHHFEIEKEQKQEKIFDDADDTATASPTEGLFVQLHKRYILTQVRQGLMVIDQQMAHQRILFEKFMESLQNHSSTYQQNLFPVAIELSSHDFEVVSELLESIRLLGIDASPFGNNTIVVHGVSQLIGDLDPRELIETMIEDFKNNLANPGMNVNETLARSLAAKAAIRPGQSLDINEMRDLVDRLFACHMPMYSPAGHLTVLTITLDDFEKRFAK